MKQQHSIKVLRATFWAYAATYSGKIMVFFSTIILARLLLKADFGLAGYALLVINFLDVLSDLGIGSALVYHRKDPKNNDTAFWLNVAVGLALFGMTWLAAPFAGAFFNEPRSIALTRVLALTFPISSLGNIQGSLLRKNLAFKQKLVPDLLQSMGKGIISIILAWLGFGAWSLVIGQVGGTAVGAIAYWWVTPWRPSLRFERSIATHLLSYGLNIVAISSLSVLRNNLDYLFIGRFLGVEALGVYTLAFRLPKLLVTQIVLTFSQANFPAYVKLRDDAGLLKEGFLTTMRYVTTITVPVALGLAVISRPLILTLYTEKWHEAIPVLSAIAILMLMRSFSHNIGDIYKAQGRPDVLTKLAILRVPFLIVGLWWATTGPATIIAVALVVVLVGFLETILSLAIAARLLHTPFKIILGTLQPTLISGGIMALVVIGTIRLLTSTEPVVQLVSGILVGMIVFGALLWLFQKDIIVQAGTNLRVAMKRT